MVAMFREFSAAKRATLVLSLLLIIIVFIGLAVWILVPKQKPLFEQIDGPAAAQAIAYLEENQVPYVVEQSLQGHRISVAEQDVERLKVTLGNELGLPKVQGLELFENVDYGMTDFTQEVTYKRALQGELARTISVMPGVASARVHITFAPKRLFSNLQENAKAAVYIEPIAQSSLDKAQVKAVQTLVANAVENLSLANVAVFGGNGVLLSQEENDGNLTGVNHQLEAKTALEQRLISKAYKLLSLLVSPQNMAVSVDVEMDFNQRKQLVQDYIADDEGKGALVRQVTSEQNQQQDAASKQTQNVTNKALEAEYQHGQRTEEVVFSTGAIKSMNVAVALRETLSQDDVETIEKLIATGLGLNSYRGDKITVAVLKAKIPATNASTIPAANSTANTQAKPANSALSSSGNISLQQAQKHASNVSVINAITTFFITWWWLGLALIAVVVAALVWWRQPRLSLEARENLLLEAQAWLQKEQAESGSRHEK